MSRTQARTRRSPARPASRRSAASRFRPTAETYEFRSTGVVDYANDRSEDREQASGCRTITIGEISYSELPPGERGPVGKRWVKSGGEAIDSEALFEQSHEQSADDAPGLGTSTIVLSGVDPTPDEYLDDLRESSGEPERVGEEDVRGVQTTRYRTKLDLRRMTRLELEEAGWQVANIERYLDGSSRAHARSTSGSTPIALCAGSSPTTRGGAPKRPRYGRVASRPPSSSTSASTLTSSRLPRRR